MRKTCDEKRLERKSVEDTDVTSAYELTMKGRFEAAKDFRSATDLIWSPSFNFHAFYQHYTTLSRVLTKLIERKWWLTRSDSESLNDRQESTKFGDKALVKRTYQASFCQGMAESVALWGLYVPKDPFAIRITIRGEAVKRWVDHLGKSKLHYSDKSDCNVGTAEFKDIIYAAVDFSEKTHDRFDIRRTNSLFWEGVNCEAAFPDLAKEVCAKECTCWMKDYEWRHERESRLCVRPVAGKCPKAAWVEVTQDLIDNMKFTFSPWLEKGREDEVRCIIHEALLSSAADHSRKIDSSRFRRSVVQGAVNLKH